jgi:hypothetical protein
MTDAEALRRWVLVAAQLEPELARWASAALWRGLSPSRRRRMRNDLLRQAARLLPGMSTWRRAHLLADLARRPGRPGVTTAAGLVALAAGVYAPARRDRRLGASQVFRLLASRRISHPPRVMQAAPGPEWALVLDTFRSREDTPP